MPTKTTSIRLEKSKLKEIDEKCEGLGCNRNDFIKNAVNEKLVGSSSLFKDCTDCDPQVHDSMMLLFQNIHDAEYTIFDSEKTGKPIKAVLIWPENDDEGFLD